MHCKLCVCTPRVEKPSTNSCETHLQVLPPGVQQELQPADPRENPHRRAPLPLPPVWQEVSKGRPPQRPHVHTRGNSTVQLQQLWKGFRVSQVSCHPQGGPLQELPPLSSILHLSILLEVPPQHLPLQGEAQAPAQLHREPDSQLLLRS